MWVSAAYIPGTHNTEAVSFSRNYNETFEWKLSTHLFQKVSSMFRNPTLDLFASRVNYQIDRCISWKPNPKALAIDAFWIKWNTEFYYIFPPISPTKAIVVIPKWLIQPLEKSDKKYEYKSISKKFGTNPVPTKSWPTTPKASPTNILHQLTTQDIINASWNINMPKIFVLSDTLERILCREKHSLW